MLKCEWRLLATLMLTFVLCSCEEQRQSDRQTAHQNCMTLGLHENTPEFAQCFEIEVSRIAKQRARVLEHIEHTPQPINAPRTSG